MKLPIAVGKVMLKEGSPTFGGNPLACAAAIAAIKFMIENEIPTQIAQKGEYLMDKLHGLQQRHPGLDDQNPWVLCPWGIIL